MTTTTLGLTTMEALAQIIRKWRLIERTSKIDLCVAVPPTLVAPLQCRPRPQSIQAAYVFVTLARLHSEPNNNNS